MSARFGHDFSRVRIHTDSSAHESAEIVGASAYTIGNDIVFGEGQYAPGTTAGARRLAHELTHVVQRERSGSPGDPTRVSQRADDSEREAEALAPRAARGGAVEVNAAPVAALARDETGDHQEYDPWSDPVWTGLTNNALSGGVSMSEVHATAQTAEHLKDAEAKLQLGKDINTAEFLAQHPDRMTPKPGIPPLDQDELETASRWHAERLQEFQEGGGAMSPLEEAGAAASRWSPVAKLARYANRALNPLGIVSNLYNMVNDFGEGHYADGVADTAGLAGSTVGTGAMLGWIDSASMLNPIGAAAGAGAGGYALGKYAVGKSDAYAQENGIFGTGAEGDNRTGSQWAADQGHAAKAFVDDRYIPTPFGDVDIPGFVGDIAGGVATAGSSWGAAAYSGLHAASRPLDLPGMVEGMNAGRQIDSGLEETMRRQAPAEIEQLLSGPARSVAYEEMPPVPNPLKAGAAGATTGKGKRRP